MLYTGLSMKSGDNSTFYFKADHCCLHWPARVKTLNVGVPTSRTKKLTDSYQKVQMVFGGL